METMVEAKLVQVPQEAGALRAEVEGFKRERDADVREVRVGARWFVTVARLLRLAGLEIGVRLDDQVRAGHAVLVGAI